MSSQISFGYPTEKHIKEDKYCSYHICFKYTASKNKREIEYDYALFIVFL